MIKIIFFILVSQMFSQDIKQAFIEFHEKPIAKDAGRVLKLNEIYRVIGESGKFYFKYPGNLRIAPDGTFYVADEYQLFHFSNDGKFIGNIYKKGQGPGEISGAFDYHIRGDEVYIFDYGSNRFFRMNHGGDYVGDIGLYKKTHSRFLGVVKDGLIVVDYVWPPAGGLSGRFADILHVIKLLSFDGRADQEIYRFKQNIFMAENATKYWGESIEVLSEDGKYIFGFHGQDYLIEILDIADRKIVKRFSRKYTHIDYVEGEREKMFRIKYKAPKMKYKSDIFNLYLDENHVWVWTSTTDQKRGDLFDVYDFEGRCLDSFYLGLGRVLLKVQGDIIFVLEKDADENYRIVKYEILT